jgi:hypothetical protein
MQSNPAINYAYQYLKSHPCTHSQPIRPGNLSITAPVVEALPNGYLFKYESEGINVSVRGINNDRAGNLVAEVDFTSDRRSDFKELLGQKINLHSLPARKRAADEITNSRIYNENYDAGGGIPFSELFEDLANRLLKLHRDGNVPVEVWPSDDISLTPEYLLEPILYLNHPSVIFGDYGSTKSLFALVVAAICQLPYYDNSLELVAPKEPSPCLYLDYEDDQSSFGKRWSALLRGMSVGEMPILYKRMTSTIADSVEGLQKLVTDKKIKLLIVDSLGPAARGNLNDPEPAIKYHSALRQIGVTSLTLAHTSKDPLNTRSRTIFGSVFFTNLARAVWEIRAETETDEDETTISLKQTKHNLSKKYPPLGYKFNFTDSSIEVVKTDLKNTGLSGELPLSFQIKNLLRSGAKTVKAIAEALEASEPSVRTITNRMYHKNQLTKIGDSWGLRIEA